MLGIVELSFWDGADTVWWVLVQIPKHEPEILHTPSDNTTVLRISTSADVLLNTDVASTLCCFHFPVKNNSRYFSYLFHFLKTTASLYRQCYNLMLIHMWEREGGKMALGLNKLWISLVRMCLSRRWRSAGFHLFQRNAMDKHHWHWIQGNSSTFARTRASGSLGL